MKMKLASSDAYLSSSLEQFQPFPSSQVRPYLLELEISMV